MKTIIKLSLFIMTCFSGNVLPAVGGDLNEYRYGEVIIGRNFPLSKEPFEGELPRNLDNVKISSIVNAADEFLKSAFGKEIKPKISNVSLQLMPDSKGTRFWCWSVGYYNLGEDDGVRSPGIFFVFISTQGKPLMSIRKRE
jgi:hypothetical protein